MKDPNYTIGCITQLTDKGVQQTVDVFGDTMKRAVNVQSAQMEEGIRVKLIQLGWTPLASGTDKHTKDAERNTSGETCIDSVLLPEPVASAYRKCMKYQSRASWCVYPGRAEDDKEWVNLYTADQLRAYGDERERVIAEDRNCWKSVAEGEAELRVIANDELEEAEARIAELESLLKTVAIRAANFPDFPMGWHIPEVFKAVGMQMPERPENDDTHDGLRARVAELQANLQNLREERDGFADGLKYWRQRAKSAEGHLPRADMDEAAKAVHMASNLSGIEWGELRWDQQHACYIAASAVVRAINSQRDARKPKNAAIAAGGGDD